MIETDAPYLAPVPKRGRRNEPAFVAHVAAALARLRGRRRSGWPGHLVNTASFFRLPEEPS